MSAQPATRVTRSSDGMLTGQSAMTPTGRRYIPTRPQISAVRRESQAPCSYEERTVLGPGYTKFHCQPVLGTAAADTLDPEQREQLENIDRCEVVLVQPMTAALVPRDCETQYAEVLGEVREEQSATGDKVLRPVLNVYGTERQLPITGATPRYEYDPTKPSDLGSANVPSESTGGGGGSGLYPAGDYAVTCGFPTEISEDGRFLNTCQRIGGKRSGRCMFHEDADLTPVQPHHYQHAAMTGGVGAGGRSASASSSSASLPLYFSMYDPAFAGGLAPPPPSHLASPLVDEYGQQQHVGGVGQPANLRGTMVTSVSPQMIGDVEPFEVGGDEQSDRRDAALSAQSQRQSALLTKNELTELFLGLPEGMHQIRPAESAALTAYEAKLAPEEQKKLVWFVYNNEYGDDETVNRDLGFNFHDRYLPEGAYARSNESASRLKAAKEQDYVKELVSLVAALNRQFPSFSNKSYNSENDTIATLEAHIIAVIADIESAPLYWERKDYVDKLGLFDRFSAFQTETDSHGKDLMHSVLRYYAFTDRVPNATTKIWKPARMRRWMPAQRGRERDYSNALWTMWENLVGQQMPPGTPPTLSVPFKTSGSRMVLGDPGAIPIAHQGTAVAASASNGGNKSPERENLRVGVLEAHVMSLLAKAQFRYQVVFNAGNTAFFDGERPSLPKAVFDRAKVNKTYVLADFILNNYGKYVSEELAKLLRQYNYTNVKERNTIWFRAKQFAIQRARNLGLVLPPERRTQLDQLGQQVTTARVLQGDETMRSLLEPQVTSVSGNIATAAAPNPLGVADRPLPAAVSTPSVEFGEGRSRVTRIGAPVQYRTIRSGQTGVDSALGPAIYTRPGEEVPFGGAVDDGDQYTTTNTGGAKPRRRRTATAATRKPARRPSSSSRAAGVASGRTTTATGIRYNVPVTIASSVFRTAGGGKKKKASAATQSKKKKKAAPRTAGCGCQNDADDGEL